MGGKEDVFCELPKGHDGVHVCGFYAWANIKKKKAPVQSVELDALTYKESTVDLIQWWII
jgi:hypothetical protein